MNHFTLPSYDPWHCPLCSDEVQAAPCQFHVVRLAANSCWSGMKRLRRPLTVTTLKTMVSNVVNSLGCAMPTIQASEFKARCLALMDEVASKGETWVVTKNGRPIAELHPYRGGRSTSPFGLHPKLEISGDIVEPLDEVEWKALA